jgi:5S rRNA maturation endonuclease (ribonuclease M5)
MSADTAESSRELILEEIQSLPGPKKVNGVSVMVRCVFHQDKTPSLGIFTGNNGKIPLGFFSCFGCGAKGPWNKLARKAGLRRIKEWSNYTESAKDLLDTTLSKKLLGVDTTTVQEVLKSFGDVADQPWPKQLDWRGYSGKLISKLGGRLIDDAYNDMCLFLPVSVNKKIVGGIKATMTKKKGRPSYINSKGDWTQTKGLFPYDHVKRMIYKNDLDYVILVEGPRDALRLVVAGLPALCVLGSRNFSVLKSLLVTSLDIETCYVLTDNDDGGDLMAENVVPLMKKRLTTKRIKLPKGGKIDPGNMSEELLEKVKKIVSKNGK